MKSFDTHRQKSEIMINKYKNLTPWKCKICGERIDPNSKEKVCMDCKKLGAE